MRRWWFCGAAIAWVGCSPVDVPPATAHGTSAARALEVEGTSPPPCIDPPEPSLPSPGFAPPLTLPPVDPPRTTGDGGVLDFVPTPTSQPIRVLYSLQNEVPERGTVTMPGAGFTLVVSTQPRPSSAPKTTTLWLRAPTSQLALYDVATTYRVLSGGRLATDKVELLLASTGAPLDQTHAPLGLVDVPNTCEEYALVSFGPIPFGMPSFKWPIRVGCKREHCSRSRLAYVQAVHATWRVTQMMDILADLEPAHREWAWGRQGLSKDLVGQGQRTSPKYWFGDFKGARFNAIRDLYEAHLTVLRQARIDGIDLRLKCPYVSSEDHNGCFTDTTPPTAHHVVKGWVNLCPRLWTWLSEWFPSDPEGWDTWFDHTVGHELYHHHYANVPDQGWKMVKDRLSHHHGDTCVNFSTHYQVSEPANNPFDLRPRHLATYRNNLNQTCGHLHVAMRNVDTYNTFARIIGRKVWKGQLKYWPEPADPTQAPPTCVGGAGCLCEDALVAGEPPDGDFHATKYCAGEDLQCTRTTFNASSTVGICKSCDALRGPGCPCKGDLLSCDVGECFGDDTRGEDSGWGQCYVEPPLFSCLADCKRLLGNGAYCLVDHPDRARCVPVGTTHAEAGECWLDEGHMDTVQNACTSTPECGPGSTPAGVPNHTCASLGYPPYYACDATRRCVVDL